jgi:hypothetical protein
MHRTNGARAPAPTGHTRDSCMLGHVYAYWFAATSLRALSKIECHFRPPCSETIWAIPMIFAPFCRSIQYEAIAPFRDVVRSRRDSSFRLPCTLLRAAAIGRPSRRMHGKRPIGTLARALAAGDRRNSRKNRPRVPSPCSETIRAIFIIFAPSRRSIQYEADAPFRKVVRRRCDSPFR